MAIAASTKPIDGWHPLAGPRHAASLAFLCLGVSLYTDNAYIFTTAVPTVVADIGGLALVSWASTVYIVASLVSAAGTAALKANLRARRGFAWAATIFIAGSLICALAPNMPVLLAGRAAQGAGSGLIVALNYMMVRTLFPQATWPKVFAAFSAMYGIAVFIGPMVGGALAELGLWRLAFVVMVPAAALLIAAIRFVLPAAPPPATPEALPALRLALIGAGVMSIALANQTGGLILPGALIAGAAILFAVVLRIDARSPRRLLPSRPFSPATPRGAGLALILCLSVSTMSFFVYGPLLMQTLHGTSPVETGYFVLLDALAWTAVAFIVANLSAVWADRLIRIGPIVTTVAVAGMAFTLPVGPLPLLALFVMLMGGGMGACWAFVTRRIMAAAEPGEEDVTASAAPVVQMVGMASGAALAGVVANGLGAGQALSVATAEAVAFWAQAGFIPVMIAGIFLAFRLAALPARQTDDRGSAAGERLIGEADGERTGQPERDVPREDGAADQREDGHRGRDAGDAAGDHEGEAGARRHAHVDQRRDGRDRGIAVEIGRHADHDARRDRPPAVATEPGADVAGRDVGDHQAFQQEGQRQPLEQEPAGGARFAGEQGTALRPMPEAPDEVDARRRRRSRAAAIADAGLERVGEGRAANQRLGRETGGEADGDCRQCLGDRELEAEHRRHQDEHLGVHQG